MRSGLGALGASCEETSEPGVATTTSGNAAPGFAGGNAAPGFASGDTAPGFADCNAASGFLSRTPKSVVSSWTPSSSLPPRTDEFLKQWVLLEILKSQV